MFHCFSSRLGKAEGNNDLVQRIGSRLPMLDDIRHHFCRGAVTVGQPLPGRDRQGPPAQLRRGHGRRVGAHHHVRLRVAGGQNQHHWTSQRGVFMRGQR